MKEAFLYAIKPIVLMNEEAFLYVVGPKRPMVLMNEEAFLYAIKPMVLMKEAFLYAIKPMVLMNEGSFPVCHKTHGVNE